MHSSNSLYCLVIQQTKGHLGTFRSAGLYIGKTFGSMLDFSEAVDVYSLRHKHRAK